MTCGIYRIVNVKNMKCYVGSSKNIEQRWKLHRDTLRTGKHHSKYLQRSYLKYGKSAFEFEVMMTCDPDYLLFYEQQFLDQWKPEYNTYVTAGSNRGAKFSDEARMKMSIRLKGKKKSKEHAAKLAIKLNQYTEENVVKTWPGLIGPDGTEYRDIRNLAKFVRDHNLHKSHIHEVAIGKIRQYKGWRLIDTPPLEKEIYNFMSPENIEYSNIEDLTSFCKEHNLNRHSMQCMASGKRKTYLGWKVLETKWDMDVSLVSPEGVIYEHIHNLSVFAKEHDLIPQSLNKVVNGIRKSLKGWKLLNGEYKGWR
jgi:group I intron endonuclease